MNLNCLRLSTTGGVNPGRWSLSWVSFGSVWLWLLRPLGNLPGRFFMLVCSLGCGWGLAEWLGITRLLAMEQNPCWKALWAFPVSWWDKLNPSWGDLFWDNSWVCNGGVSKVLYRIFPPEILRWVWDKVEDGNKRTKVPPAKTSSKLP